MKREYLNVSKLSLESGISYDRIMRAVRFDLFDVFSEEEKMKLHSASAKLLDEHRSEHIALEERLGI